MPRPPRPPRAAALALSLSLAGALSLAAPARADFGNLLGTQPNELDGGGHFEEADGCRACHGGGYQGDRTYLPNDTWAGTMMGNAARDPVFFAALAVANQDEPGVGTFCLRCHSPLGFVRGHGSPPDGSAFDAVDRQGVGCDACHRAVTAPPPHAPYLVGDAQLYYSNDLAKRGPYADVDSPAHEGKLDPDLSSSRFCGQCHQVSIPGRRMRDAAGEELAVDFPLDTTYEEWESSDFSAGPGAKSCVDCHMRKKSGEWPVSRMPGSPPRKDPRDHAFVGGNHWGIRAVMMADPDRAEAFAPAFELALERTLESLGSAASVTLSGAPERAEPGSTFAVTVRVENLTGHKFPTGYAESRRAWLALVLEAEGGPETFLVGGYDEASGEIRAEPKTRVYKAVHGRWNGSKAEAEEHLALHDSVISDTRIPPKGFVPSLTTLPKGEIDYAGDPTFRHWDEASFEVKVPEGLSGKAILSARVYYQSMTRAHVEFLKEANHTDSSGEALSAIYEATGRAAPILVAKHDAELDLGGAAGGPGAGGSGGEAGAGAGGEAGARPNEGGAAEPGGAEPASGCGGCAASRASPAGAATLLFLLALAAARRAPRSVAGRSFRRAARRSQ